MYSDRSSSKRVYEASQSSFFGHTSLDFDERPPIPVSDTDRSAGSLPSFESRYYKTERRLQSRPTKITPNVISLWPEVRSDRERPGYTQPKVLPNIAVAAQRSLLAINYNVL
jgi:hypothetical protein